VVPVDDHPIDDAGADAPSEPIDVELTADDAEAQAATAEHDPYAGIEFEDDGVDDEAPRHNALPRRVESWRTRTATGAVMSAMAMGLHQVFAKEQEKPAIVQEAPSDPYDDDDPVIVEYAADDAEGTTVILRPWLLKKDEGA
jgi:hypothetical protein